MSLRILILMGGYWPGHEATGPNQSLRQMCQAMCDRHEFFVLARDRPFGARQQAATSGHWLDHQFAKVRYTPVSTSGPHDLRTILQTTPHDILWMNGFHDREFTLPALVLRRMGLVQPQPAILSARGELADGALSLKSPRKLLYRQIARGFDLLRDVWLHATSSEESEDIEQHYPWSRGVLQAPNVRALVDFPAAPQAARAADEPLRIALVGRIARVKNIAFAIEALSHVSHPASLEIIGPIEDGEYWRECQYLASKLPTHLRVTHAGIVANADIPAKIGTADLFFLPTLGENFGHAIFEALSCGVPVLISNRTPWKNLSEHSAGWEVPLENALAFAARIDALAAMSTEDRARLRCGARRLAENYVTHSGAVTATERMFALITGDAGLRSAA